MTEQYGLLVAIGLGIVGVVLWQFLRRRSPKTPRCADCRLEMVSAGVVPEALPIRHVFALGFGPAGLTGRPMMHLYQCPKCNKRARIRR